MRTENGRTRMPKRPRPIFDGAMIRLLMLFGLFLGVIYLIFVASDPETWVGLGFGDPESGAESAEGAGAAEHRGKSVEEDSVINPDDPIVRAAPEPNSSASSAQENEEKPFSFRLDKLEQKIESVEMDFWRQVYDRLSHDQRRGLYSFLRFAEGKITADSSTIGAFQKMSEAIKKWREEYEGKLLEHVSSLPAAKVEQKTTWNEILFQIRRAWSQDYFPALTCRLNDKDADDTVIQSLLAIRKQIKGQSVRFLRDGTSVSRAKDAVAWLMTWEEILAIDQATINKQSTLITQVELSSQPVSFRGRWVQIRGQVRSAKLQTTQNHELGIEQYYVLWIQPQERSTVPYCVYALSLPVGFPPVERQLVKLDETVVIQGQFFKVRSYEAKAGWRECPLILANEPVWYPQDSLPAENASILPGWPVMIGMLLLIAMVATGLAYWVFRSTQSSRLTTESQEQRLAQEFVDLKTNSKIETVADRLRKISND